MKRSNNEATIVRIKNKAKQELSERSKFTIVVKIGIVNYAFTIKRFKYGYELRKSNDIIAEYDREERILTALFQEIERYV